MMSFWFALNIIQSSSYEDHDMIKPSLLIHSSPHHDQSCYASGCEQCMHVAGCVCVLIKNNSNSHHRVRATVWDLFASSSTMWRTSYEGFEKRREINYHFILLSHLLMSCTLQNWLRNSLFMINPKVWSWDLYVKWITRYLNNNAYYHWDNKIIQKI